MNSGRNDSAMVLAQLKKRQEGRLSPTTIEYGEAVYSYNVLFGNQHDDSFYDNNNDPNNYFHSLKNLKKTFEKFLTTDNKSNYRYADHYYTKIDDALNRYIKENQLCGSFTKVNGIPNYHYKKRINNAIVTIPLLICAAPKSPYDHFELAEALRKKILYDGGACMVAPKDRTPLIDHLYDDAKIAGHEDAQQITVTTYISLDNRPVSIWSKSILKDVDHFFELAYNMYLTNDRNYDKNITVGENYWIRNNISISEIALSILVLGDRCGHSNCSALLEIVRKKDAQEAPESPTPPRPAKPEPNYQQALFTKNQLTSPIVQPTPCYLSTSRRLTV